MKFIDSTTVISSNILPLVNIFMLWILDRKQKRNFFFFRNWFLLKNVVKHVSYLQTWSSIPRKFTRKNERPRHCFPSYKVKSDKDQRLVFTPRKLSEGISQKYITLTRKAALWQYLQSIYLWKIKYATVLIQLHFIGHRIHAC